MFTLNIKDTIVIKLPRISLTKIFIRSYFSTEKNLKVDIKEVVLLYYYQLVLISTDTS